MPCSACVSELLAVLPELVALDLKQHVKTFCRPGAANPCSKRRHQRLRAQFPLHCLRKKSGRLGLDVLAQVMRNLLDNAIRYTPEGGQVNIRIAQQPEALILAVDDSGPGIPAEERERAFQRFYRGRREAGDGVGSGLGLAIVANIAARHGAEVALLDSALGGLRVELRFPAPRPDADASP